jgi:hypothetical protein
MGGVALPCPTGAYGSVPGLTSPTCSGVCAEGYECPPGSVSPTAVPCPLGHYCTGGQGVQCPGGRYNDVPGARSVEGCVACGAGRYSSGVGVGTAAACAPCDAEGEGSDPGSTQCWPGVLSVVASNPPPLVPGFSEGDVVTVTFTQPTDKATQGPSGSGLVLAFSPAIGATVASWTQDGRQLLVRVVDVGGVDPAGVDVAAGLLRVSVGGVRGVGGPQASPRSPPASLVVTGTWGSPGPPSLLLATARDTGDNVGLGSGDTLVLTFDPAVRQVGVGTPGAVDALVALTPPLPGGAGGVVGEWESGTSLVLRFVLEGPVWGALATRSPWGVGSLGVRIRGEGVCWLCVRPGPCVVCACTGRPLAHSRV